MPSLPNSTTSALIDPGLDPGLDPAIDGAMAMIAGPTPLADWLLVLPVALPLLIGAVLVMSRHYSRLHPLAALVTMAAMTLTNGALLLRVLTEGPLSMTMGSWVPPFGIAFTADALGASMALVASFVGFACTLYSLMDIDATKQRYGYYAFLLLMMGGVNGAFLTGDIFNLYVWFEVFLISSFGLIILGSESRQIDGAVKYGILNLLGTTLFLTAVALLYGATGSLNMADLTRRLADPALDIPAVSIGALFLFAFAMKAGAFPLNFWLPASYHTPRIVVGALFGSLLTKIGVYALLRMFGMMMPEQLAGFSTVIGWIAVATMLLGVMGALAQNDLRRVLGFFVISGVGVMMAGLAIGGERALAGSYFYALHSILTLGALYLLAGLISRFGGSYRLSDVAGIAKASKFTMVTAFILLLAIAGLPPASGLWPKIMLIDAALAGDRVGLALAILLTGFLTLITFGRVFILMVWRPGPENTVYPSAGGLRAGQVALVLLLIPIVFIGLYPEPLAALSIHASGGLADPSAYIDSVFSVEPVR